MGEPGNGVVRAREPRARGDRAGRHLRRAGGTPEVGEAALGDVVGAFHPNQQDRAMRIAIVGPGGIGCLFAGLLSHGGHDVWLIDRHADRAHVLDRRGIWVSGVSGEFRSPVRATAQPRDVGPVDLVLIAVKSYDTAAAAMAAQPLVSPETNVLTLQNGLGNLETLQQTLGMERVLGGVTSQAATLIAPGQVHHAGIGMTVIGEPSGDLSERLSTMEGAFRSEE